MQLEYVPMIEFITSNANPPFALFTYTSKEVIIKQLSPKRSPDYLIMKSVKSGKIGMELVQNLRKLVKF